MKELETNKLKIKLPKFISLSKDGKFVVIVKSKKYNKNFYVGTFEDIEQAIKVRDTYILENKNDITLGSFPRGVSYYKNTNRYCSFLSINGTRIIIGYFSSLKEAHEYRLKFIESLK